MNAEQKQRAQAALTKWWATDSNKAVLSTGYEMAGVLQELVDAPEAEPVAWMVYGRDGVWLHVVRYEKDVDEYRARGFKVSPFYTAPPAPSVPDGMKLIPKVATPEMLAGLIGAGCCKSLEKAYAALYAAAPTPAEAPADVARDAERWRMLPAFLEEFEISYLRLEDAIDAAIAAEKGQQA